MVQARKLAELKDKVGTVIEEGDVIAYAVTHYQSALLRVGTVIGFTEKSIRVEIPEDTYEDFVDEKTGARKKKIEMKKMSVSKDKTANVIVVIKKEELDKIDALR
jgi:hypothetical protein